MRVQDPSACLIQRLKISSEMLCYARSYTQHRTNKVTEIHHRNVGIGAAFQWLWQNWFLNFSSHPKSTGHH